MALQAAIEDIELRVHSPQHGGVVRRMVPVIFPDNFAAALFRHSEHVFRHFFFGKVNARKFWKHHADRCQWFQQHPAFSYNKRSHLIPLSLYGDEVQTYKGSEVGSIEIFGWCSDFAEGQTPLSRYMPILCLSEHLVCDGTWSDIWDRLIPRLQRMFTHDDYVWSPAGYRFMASSLQGDLKWLLQKFGVFNYLRNDLCSWCGCVKSHHDQSMTLGDMRPDAAHVGTLISHADFLAGGSEAARTW